MMVCSEREAFFFFFISKKGDVFALLEEITGCGEVRGVGDNFVHWFSS